MKGAEAWEKKLREEESKENTARSAEKLQIEHERSR